jgi:dihydroorotate dehydrogenase (NAD+) catalytic subunit
MMDTKFMDNAPDLTTNIDGIQLRNPVMTASGTFGYAREFETYVNLNRLGGIIVKGLSLLPSMGNRPPRIIETACGMLNAIGLENVGIETFIKEKLPFLKRLTTPVFVNIYGRSIDEYAALAERVEAVDGIAGIEVNISCPNVKAGGVAFGVDPDAAGQVVSEVRRKTTKTLIVKLSPNVTDVTAIAKRVIGEGADALSLINTITGMAIDVDKRRPILANITGGLSGPAIKPVALRMVWQVCQTVEVPVIGIGGITTARDALEFLIAGASAIQVGTANFINPAATMDIIGGIEDYLKEHNLDRLTDLIGSLEV